MHTPIEATTLFGRQNSSQCRLTVQGPLVCQKIRHYDYKYSSITTEILTQQVSGHFGTKTLRHQCSCCTQGGVKIYTITRSHKRAQKNTNSHQNGIPNARDILIISYIHSSNYNFYILICWRIAMHNNHLLRKIHNFSKILYCLCCVLQYSLLSLLAVAKANKENALQSCLRRVLSSCVKSRRVLTIARDQLWRFIIAIRPQP